MAINFVTKGYLFRIYPNVKQEVLINKTFGCSRFVYNYFLARRTALYESEHRTLSYNECSKELTQLKTTCVWLKEVDSTALQSCLRNLDFAFQNFFKRVSKDIKPYGYPKFRRKHVTEQSYTSKSNIAVFDNCIRLPKLGLVKCRVSQKVEGRILNATVVRRSTGQYFVSLCCQDVPVEEYSTTNAVCGVDIGVKSLAILSDGKTYDNHKYLMKSEDKLKRLHRRLSRKTRGSHNYGKAKQRLAKVEAKVRNQRNDSIHKMTTDIVRNYDVICIEDLAVKNMVKNHKLAKAITDASFGMIRRQLGYKAAWHHKIIAVIDRYYPSSQLCSCCGYQNHDVTNLQIRNWSCPVCGTQHDRDVNAAKNILKEGLQQIAVAS